MSDFLDHAYDPDGYDAYIDGQGAAPSGNYAANAAANNACSRSATACIEPAWPVYPDTTAENARQARIRSATRTSERKEEELSCSKNRTAMLDRLSFLRRVLKGSSRAEQCDNPRETSVYRFLAANRRDVAYVGVGYDPRERCAVRARVLRLPVANCKIVMTLPNRPLAYAVESYLIEVYGFNVIDKNFNYDANLVLNPGTFNGNRPSLTNTIRSYYPKGARTIYCAAMAAGALTINLYRPNFIGIYPPGSKFWWPNFSARDCLESPTSGGNGDHGLLEKGFELIEGRPPANPRIDIG